MTARSHYSLARNDNWTTPISFVRSHTGDWRLPKQFPSYEYVDGHGDTDNLKSAMQTGLVQNTNGTQHRDHPDV